MASAVWIWLRVSYEAAVKLSARATVSQGHRQPGPPSAGATVIPELGRGWRTCLQASLHAELLAGVRPCWRLASVLTT